MKKVISLILGLGALLLIAATVSAAEAPPLTTGSSLPDINGFRRTPQPTATPQRTATPQPTATAQPLTIDTASEGYSCNNGVCAFPSGNVGAQYAAPITSSGGSGPTPYTWSVVAGSLPAGLALTPSYGVYSAYVYGTPTKAQTSTFTLQVRDGIGDTARQAFTLTINPPAPLVITLPGPTSNSGTVGTAYNQNLFASGGVPPYTWSITGGQLPPGLQVTNSKNGNSINGTPTSSGTFTFTLTVTDSAGTQTSEQTSITVN
jgi:hypothetical protein